MTFVFRKTSKRRCRKKQGYTTYRKALKAKRIYFNKTGIELWPYRCDKCQRYHLSSMVQTKEKEDDNGSQ